MGKIDDYMAGFGKEIGLETPFKADYPGVYMFSTGEDVTVSVIDKNGDIALTATFGPLPQGDQEMFYTDLLTADLFYQGTERSVLGINTENKKFIVKKIIDRPINDKEFTDEMEDFLNTVEVWREKVAEMSK